MPPKKNAKQQHVARAAGTQQKKKKDNQHAVPVAARQSDSNNDDDDNNEIPPLYDPRLPIWHAFLDVNTSVYERILWPVSLLIPLTWFLVNIRWYLPDILVNAREMYDNQLCHNLTNANVGLWLLYQLFWNVYGMPLMYVTIQTAITILVLLGRHLANLTFHEEIHLSRFYKRVRRRETMQNANDIKKKNKL